MERDRPEEGRAHPGCGIAGPRVECSELAATPQGRPGEAQNRRPPARRNHRDPQVDRPSSEHGRARIPFRLPQNRPTLNMEICATDPMSANQRIQTTLADGSFWLY